MKKFRLKAARWKQKLNKNQFPNSVNSIFQVVAAVCCFIVTLLMIISICPVDWVDTAPSMKADTLYREGLFRVCPVSNIEGVQLDKSERECYNQSRG